MRKTPCIHITPQWGTVFFIDKMSHLFYRTHRNNLWKKNRI